MLIRLTRFAPLVVAFSLAPTCALADTGSPAPAAHSAAPAAASQTLHFIVNITPRMSKSVPWTGDLTLKINPEGIINGTYRSTSVRPDPFYGKITTVTGGLKGQNIRLEFGAKGNFPVKGEYHAGAGIVATAHTRSGQIYDFVAKQESK